MPAYAVLRIQKLKSWGDIAGSDDLFCLLFEPGILAL